MFRMAKSNRNYNYDKLKNLSVASLCAFILASCNSTLTENNYSSSVDGYESRVASVNYEAAKDIKEKSAKFASVGAPPVIINNPLALGQNLGYAPNGAFANNVFMQGGGSAGGSAYGSLNSGVIQQGVFMPNSGAGGYSANNFGNNFISPTSR
jgi:hypothetical protein